MKRTTIFYGLKGNKGYVSEIKVSKYGDNEIIYPCYTDCILDCIRLTEYEYAELHKNAIKDELEIFPLEVTCEAIELQEERGWTL